MGRWNHKRTWWLSHGKCRKMNQLKMAQKASAFKQHVAQTPVHRNTDGKPVRKCLCPHASTTTMPLAAHGICG